MSKTITIKSLEQLPHAAKEITNFCSKENIFAFYGEMGSGKTTLIKTICIELGVTDNTSSPTFSLINEYQTKDNKKIYHFDFYRIKNENEAYDLGYEDYFYSGAYCFIEWPEKIASLLPKEYVKIHITEMDGSRIITINK